MLLIREEMKTIDYIYALPEGERAELIDGAIYDMAPPSVNHQRIARELSADLTNYIRKNNGKCEVFSLRLLCFWEMTNTTMLSRILL